jgi:hypothetical protein
LLHYPNAAIRVLGVDRDVESELRAASAFKPTVNAPPSRVRQIAEGLGRTTRCFPRTVSLSFAPQIRQQTHLDLLSH